MLHGTITPSGDPSVGAKHWHENL